MRWPQVALVASTLAVSCCKAEPGDRRTDSLQCPQCPPSAVADGGTEIVTGLNWFVLRVIDGDTLVARLEEPGRATRVETIRLLRINTPEKDQPGFGEAREALKGLVRGGDFTMVFEDPGVEKRGNYGRLLAYAIVDGLNVNVEMVRLGWSKFWTKYGGGRLAADFKAAEAEARSDRRGLWGLSASGSPAQGATEPGAPGNAAGP